MHELLEDWLLLPFAFASVLTLLGFHELVQQLLLDVPRNAIHQVSRNLHFVLAE